MVLRVPIVREEGVLVSAARATHCHRINGLTQLKFISLQFDTVEGHNGS